MGSSFIGGFASGIIVTLAIMVGLTAGTQEQKAVISGIVIVAVVEGFSDAYSEYLAQRSDKTRTAAAVWKETATFFGAKFFIVFQFIFPFFFLPLLDATQFSIFWGVFLLSIISGYIARQQEKSKVIRTMVLYDVAAIMIMIITYYIGDLVAFLFSLFGL